jgi:glutaconate CoA-transferase subunit A
MAYASRQTLVTAEKISETSLLDDETVAAGVLPALYVDAVAHAPAGAAPYGLWGFVAPDPQAIADYAHAARTEAGFERWLERRLEARLAGGGSAQRSDAALPA